MFLTTLVSLGVLAAALAAPTTASPQAASDTLAVRARLIDENGAPLRDEPIALSVVEYFGSGSKSVGRRLKSDADGVVAFEAPGAAVNSAATWEYEFRLPRAVNGEIWSACRVAPLVQARSEHDLGDCVLAPPGSDVALRRADDQGLEREFARRLDLRSRNGLREREVQTVLGEMARRGGAHWIERLERELRETQGARALEQPVLNGHNELVLLTALRRAQRAPEPAQLVLERNTPLSCASSELPTLSFALRNVDPQFAFEFSNRAFQRTRVTLVTAKGGTVARKQAPDGVIGGGFAMSWRLRPGESSSSKPDEGWLDVDLNEQFGPLEPGEYSVTRSYSPTDEVAFAPSTRGWILMSSEPFTLRVH